MKYHLPVTLPNNQYIDFGRFLTAKFSIVLPPTDSFAVEIQDDPETWDNSRQPNLFLYTDDPQLFDFIVKQIEELQNEFRNLKPTTSPTDPTPSTFSSSR